MSNTYTIVIKNETSGERQTVATTEDNFSDARNNLANQLESGANTKLLSGVAMYGYAKSISNRIVSHEINTVALRTGQNELEQQLQFNYEIGKQVWNIGESIFAGLLVTGGNPIGAVAGAVMSVGNTLIGYAQAQDTINMQRAVENISIGQRNIRMGVQTIRTNNR